MVMTLMSNPKGAVATVIVAADGSGDTTDIQTGIDLLPATGGVVYIKEGTYEIDTRITITNNNIAIIGAGRSTRIEMDVATPGGFPGIIRVTNVEGILIENLFITTSIVTNVGIAFDTVIRSMINYCWIENGGAGIRLDTSTYNIIEGCLVYQNNGQGIQLIYNSDYNLITGNKVYENVLSGIRVSNNCHNNIINGNVVKDNDVNNTATYDGILIALNADNNIITNNRCEDNDRYEININAATENKNIVVGNSCVGADHVGAINDAGTGTIDVHNAS